MATSWVLGGSRDSELNSGWGGWSGYPGTPTALPGSIARVTPSFGHGRSLRANTGRELVEDQLRVVNHPLEIDDDHWFVAHDPRIMPGRQQRNIARLAVELVTVVHADPHQA